MPELRRPDPLHDLVCIECDACIDICPVDCLTIVPNAEEPELRERLLAPAINRTSRCSHPAGEADRPGLVKDENVCLHCGLCAERCPTYAWDMASSTSSSTLAS